MRKFIGVKYVTKRYEMIVKHRKWCTKAPPYKVEELVEMMSDYFPDDYWDISDEIEQTIVKGCFI